MTALGQLVITRLLGGLGNQMFQYAAGRALGLQNSARVLADTSDLGLARSHPDFELPRAFSGNFPVATKQDISSVLGWRMPLRRHLLRRAFSRFSLGSLLIEPEFAYWPGFRRASGHCYLAGYWQSELYFAKAADLVRKDFTFHPANEVNAEMDERIRKVDAVSVHVRRGDYASNPTIGALHGLCSVGYYRRAAQYLVDRVPGAVFFVFSDDLEWCATALQLPGTCHFVSINRGLDSFNDMRLMSACKHHVIANSTFSWWGAWLNPSPDKIVIAPRSWFAVSDQDISSICPPSWIRLE